VELTNEFRVDVPPEEAWTVLTDVERIAPCMPGAQLQEVEGDEYRGVVKVKVGPITAQYKGTATFLEQDAPRRAVLRAEGREARGQGRATATITAELAGDGTGTVVSLTTDLAISGKVAQFGRGMLADVSTSLVGQFVECLGTTVLAGDAPASGAPGVATAPDPALEGPAPAADAPDVRRIDGPEAEPVDLLATTASPVATRVAPVAAGLALLFLLRLFLRRRRRRGDGGHHGEGVAA
jgi:carbon monoxide dehydrogenase subunit G